MIDPKKIAEWAALADELRAKMATTEIDLSDGPDMERLRGAVATLGLDAAPALLSEREEMQREIERLRSGDAVSERGPS